MRRPLLLLIALLGLAAAATGCEPATTQTPNPTVLIPTSIDGTGATDVTTAMTNFLASVPDGSVVELQADATYRMESTLIITHRNGLAIDGNGATFVATTRADRDRANVRVLDSTAISFSDLKVKGANPDGGLNDDAQDTTLEGQAGIEARSVNGLVLDHVTITDVWGDFVWLGRDEQNPWSSNVVIENCTFARNGRMGVSLTAVTNVTIENNNIDQIHRATFDMEAHYAGFGATYVDIKDNTIGVGRLYLVSSVGIGDVSHFTFEGNTVARNLDIVMTSQDGTVYPDWKILNNTSSTLAANPRGSSMSFDHLDGLTVSGNHQAVEKGRVMVGAAVTASCNVSITGNDYPGATSQGTVTGTC